MRLRLVLIVVVVALLAAFGYVRKQSLERDRQRQQVALSAVRFGAEPAQFEPYKASFAFKGFKVQPLAGFLIRARVLSRADYSIGPEARLSPFDLALGWKRMAEPAVYQALNVSQGGRWYRYSWRGQPPIPPQEIVESSGNMHMIPADSAVEHVLAQADEGRFVRIKGLLVEVTQDNGWKWRSSLSRSDTGAGSCEVVYAEAAEVE